MRLTPMRFKDYTWPHNPETCVLELRRRVAAHKLPLGGCVLQDLGETHRVLRGGGTFAGDGAYEEFRALERVFREEGEGLLAHPLWPAARAYFVSLELAEEPLPDYVRYAFEFWEPGGNGGGLTRVEGGEALPDGGGPEKRPETADYLVKKGDTLWGIARRYGVTLAALIRANPQIKNPNLIYPGDRVAIP